MEAVWILLRVLVVTALVGMLAYGAGRYVRLRWTGLARGRHLELLESITVGTRQHVALVRVGRRIVCLGITPEAVRALLVLDELVDADESRPAKDGERNG
ncbi:MAG TPA: flagellar biosynthetic protein FliO [Bacillota bacterium]